MTTSQVTNYRDMKFIAFSTGFVSIYKANVPVAQLPTKLLKGVPAVAIMSVVDRCAADYKEVARRAEILKALFPGLSFGYLGNIETSFDDRSFYFFFPHPGRVGTYEDRVGGYSFSQLGDMLAKWDAIEARVRRVMEAK